MDHKALYVRAPEYIKEHLGPYVPGHALRSSDAHMLNCPRWKKATLDGRAFSVLVPQSWNKHPDNLRKYASYLQFRKLLKTVLFIQALE